MRILLPILAMLSVSASAGESFNPEKLGGHVTVRVAFGLRDVRGVKVDGRLDDAPWSRIEPITALRSSGSGGPGLRPLYIRHKSTGGPIRLAADPTFVRVACDRRFMYLAVTCLLAPRGKDAKVRPIERDMVLFRLDPGGRGRHALEIVFNLSGRRRSYDSHENWAYGYVPEMRFSGRKLSAEDAATLPAPERAALAKIGTGADGWLMEAAVPWRELADSPQPGEGRVWGVQVTRSSAAGENSSWGRNTFNGFDPQGHVYFLSRPPKVRVDALTFGRTLEGLTPWTVYLRNASAEAAGVRVRLACRHRIENVEFKGARLAPGESRRLVAWLPYGGGVNRVEARVADGGGKPVYRCDLLALVRKSTGASVLSGSGGYAAASVSPQTAAPGAELALKLDWEEDILGRCPLGSESGEKLAVRFRPREGGGGELEVLAPAAAPPDHPGPFGGGKLSFKVRLPADAPQGFAELALVSGDVEATVPLYVSGAKLESFRKLLAEARAAFEKADGMSCEDAKSLHWGSAPPGYPEKRDPNEFTALFGGKYNVIYGERLLAAAAKRCSVLEGVPEYERDLRYRLERLRAGKRPERGILWKAYKSRFDGAWQPYSIYVPENYDPAGKYPLIIDLHGYSGGWNLKPDQDKVRAARRLGCLLLKPYLRGMTWYMAWGEREMLDLLAAVRAEYSVDPDRIHVSGFSMGGCGTMKFLASYPDVFASGGGSSGRAEPMGAERTAVTPSWTSDGFKDQGTPWTGGRMFALHAAEVEPVSARHRGDAFTGHGYLIDRVSLYSWLLAHPMNRWPKRLRFTVWSARFASLRWVKEVEPERYGRMVRVVAEARGGKLYLDTGNAAGLRLALSGRLVAPGEPVRVVWNGRETRFPAGSREVRLGSLSGERPAGRKRPNELAGPIEDFLIRKFVIVSGTGDGAAKGIDDGVKSLLERWQHAYQGKPEVLADTKAPREKLASGHLLCVGTETTNAFLREHAGKLPVRVAAGKIRIGRKSTPAAGAKWWFLTLNPLNPDRYMLVVGSDRPEDTARALRPLISKPFRHFDYAVYGERSARPRSERTARFAKLMGISAFGWFDGEWKPYPRDPLLPDCEFMDNQNPSLVLTPDGEWRPGCEPALRRAKD